MKKLIATALIALSPAAFAGPVSWDQSALTLPVIENFEGFAPVNPVDGKEYTGPVAIYSAYMSGAFLNQGYTTGTNVNGDPYEILTGTPVAMSELAMKGQGQDQNVLLVDTDLGSGVNIAAMGLIDFFTEGVVSFLFGADQLSFGLDLVGVDRTNASLFLTFYARNGDVIGDTFTNPLTITGTDLVNGPYSFTSTQAFAGVSLGNTDIFGIAYDNLRYKVPEPATGLLLGGGLLGLVASVRRRRAAAR